MTDYTELKRLAEAASQGEWTCSAKHDGRFWHISCGNQAIGATHAASKKANPAYAEPFEANAKFIASANPSAVLALIAENDRLAKIFTDAPDLPDTDVEWLEKTRVLEEERDQLRAEVAGLRTGYEAYEQVNAELKAEVEGLRESNDKLTRRNGMLEKNVEVMTETHVLYTWLRKKVDQRSNDVVAVHMNIGHDWSTVHDLDTDLRAMIEREEP